MYRVMLVDDQPIFRDIIKGVLQRTGQFQFIGEAGDGSEALEMYAQLQPGLVIMDVQMPEVNGFEATARIVQDNPDAMVILTSMRDDPTFASVARESGAIGFLPKRGFNAESVLTLLASQSGGFFQDQAA